MHKSKKKLFTLIDGAQIHLSPNVRHLPSAEYTKAMTAEEIIQAVQQDALHYREEVIAECELIKAQAAKDGFEAGFAAWADHVAQLEDQIAAVEKNYEKVLVPVALKAAKKILGAELQSREDAIVDIVANILKNVAQHKRITIFISRKSMDILEQHRPRLKTIFEDLQVLSIRERDDVGEGGCVIETEGGIINAQLENQWLILEQAFQSLFRTASPPVEKPASEEITNG